MEKIKWLLPIVPAEKDRKRERGRREKGKEGAEEMEWTEEREIDRVSLNRSEVVNKEL